MGRSLDLVGQRFGRLVVVSRAERIGMYGGAYWICQCDCGNIKEIRTSGLTFSNTRSCGCLQREANKKAVTTHGASRTKLYKVWNSMRQRCENPHVDCYKNYGGRGISVCDEWLSFVPFYKWAIENGYKPNIKLTIERMNNDGNYEPGNCKWASYTVQSYNKRAFNSSGVKGISWSNRRKCWVAQIWINKQAIYIGQFKKLSTAKAKVKAKRAELMALC